MGSKLSEEMIMEIILRSSLKTLDAMRCTSNDLDKLTYDSYFLDHYKKINNIVFGCLFQNTIRGCINVQEFVASPDSNTLNLKFLPDNTKVLACSEHGIMVFKSPNPRFHMKDLYHICKPATQQVLPLPNPKTKYTTQKVAIVVRSMNPLHYKIVRLSEPKCCVLLKKDKKRYSRVEIFDSKEWVWSSVPDLVMLPDCVHLTNPQPITTRGSVYMLLTNGDILRVDAYSATWEILTPPAPILECDQDGTSKQLVKYSGKLGFAFKPPNGCWEIWVLNIGQSWEKVHVFNVNQDTGNKPIKAGLYDADTRALADSGTIVSHMFKGGETDSSQIFSFRSDFEPTDLCGRQKLMAGLDILSF